MKNIGTRLQAAREEKGFSIEDVVRETNIARKYIIALEAEDFSEFPAEAYVLGFLKNYGEYLGLDVKELQNQYKVLKIQEQPIPVNELLNKPSSLPRILVRAIIILVIAALAGGGAYFIINIPKRTEQVEVAERVKTEHTLINGLLEYRFFKGDSVSIPTDDEPYRIELANIGEIITLSSPQGEIKLGLNQDTVIDANEDGIAELRIHAADYVQNQADKGALLRFEITPGMVAGVSPESAEPVQAEVVNTAPPGVPQGSQIIFSSGNPYPFTLQVAFQGYCMFRWEVLREAGRQNRNERYFVRGDDIDISAVQNGVRLWMSNAGAAKIQAIGGGRTVAVEVGQAGAVVVAEVEWRRGEDGRWNLVLSRLEN